MSVPKGPDIEYVRGDLVAIAITFTQASAQFTWLGYTDIEITVNPEDTPADATGQIIQFTGTPRATDGSDGTVDFVPPNQAASDALVPGEYFYDMQAIDGSGSKATFLLAGSFVVLQDINKD